MLSALMLATLAAGAPADRVPLPYAVCVTLVADPAIILRHSPPLRPRFDSYWATIEEARARRAEILAADTWVTRGEAVDEEDEYPRAQIRKVTVDETEDASICLPAPAARR